MRYISLGITLLIWGHLATGQDTPRVSCDSYRVRFERIKVGDAWTKIQQVFGRSTNAEDTSADETVYTFEYPGCKLKFTAGSDDKVKAKEAIPPITPPKEPDPVTARQLEAGFQALQSGSGCAAAVTVWRPLAERGNRDAQGLIAFAYTGLDFSLKTPNDVTNHEKLLRREIATYRNEARSFQCDDAFKSDSEAAAWWLRAAELGLYSAQNITAVWYALGRGFHRDYVMAYAWADLAGSQMKDLGFSGDSDYHMRDCLSKVMTPEQIARAQSFSGSHRPPYDLASDARINWGISNLNLGEKDVCRIVADLQSSQDPGDSVEQEVERIGSGPHLQIIEAYPFQPSLEQLGRAGLRSVSRTSKSTRLDPRPLEHSVRHLCCW